MTYTTPVNATSLSEIFKYANYATGNIFGVGILITLFISIAGYLIMKREHVADSFTVAGFVTTISAVFLFLGGYIVDWHLFMSIMVLVLSALWSYLSKS